MSPATMRRLADGEGQRQGMMPWCSLGACRRPATCVGERGGVQATYCEECAGAVCRVNHVAMPPPRMDQVPPPAALRDPPLIQTERPWHPEAVK